MDNKTLAQLYLHAIEQRDHNGISEYEQQILAIDGFNEEGVTADTIYRNRLSVFCRYVKSWTEKHAQKNESRVLQDLSMAEKNFSNLQNKDDYAYATLGNCYSYAALCYNAKEEGRAKIAAIVERAKSNGVPLEYLRELCKNRGLSEELRAEINNAINAAGKANFDAAQIEGLQQTLPNFSYYSNGAQAAAQIESLGNGVGAGLLQAQEQLFCVELFKKAVYGKVTDQNVLAALKSDEAKVDVSLFYVPVGIMSWEATPVHYRWSWESGSYYAHGTFDYGANSMFKCQDLAGSANSLLGQTADKLDAEFRNDTLKRQIMVSDANYVLINYDEVPVPWGLSHSIDDAKKAIAKETGRDAYQIKLEVVNKARYIYDVKGVMYVPFYAVRLVSGDYVAKGTINAYYATDVKIDDVANVANGNYYSYLGREFKQGKSVRPEKRRIGLKVVSGLALLAAIALIVINFVLKGAFFVSYALYPVVPSLIFFILTFKTKKKVLWGVLTILTALASIVCSLLYLLL